MGRDHWRVERTGYSPWGALALVLLTALALVRNGPDPSPRPPRPVAAASAERHQDAPGAPPADVTVQPLAYAPASRVVIPAIRVDAPLIDVNLEPDGSIETPLRRIPGLPGGTATVSHRASWALPSSSAMSTPWRDPPCSTVSVR